MTLIRRLRGLVGTALIWGAIGAVVGVGAFVAVFRPWPLNAETLPPGFDVAQGHQLVGSLNVPVSAFEAGDYRLAIKVTDNKSGKSLTHDVAFTVAGS